VSMPFYVPPEQMMKDRADYARKGIARGRSLVAFSATDGIVIVAENQYRTLHKVGEITHEMKPYEVEILLAQVGATQDADELYHITYDGTVMDEQGATVLGGAAELIATQIESRYDRSIDGAAAIRLGAELLAEPDSPPLPANQLEVGMLVRSRPRRAFRRFEDEELEAILAG
jgi:proteasome alpha subunit